MRHSFSDLNAFRLDPLSFLLEQGNAEEPGLVPLNIGFQPHFLVTDPDLARKVLKTKSDFIDKGRLVRKLKPFIGDSFLLSGGKEHIERREVLHHQLARGVAQRYVPEMAALVRQSTARLARSNSFNAHEVTAPIALDMICVALFGHQNLTSGDRQALIGALNLIEDEIADEMFRAAPLAPWTYLARRQKRQAARRTMTFVVNKVRRNAAESSVLHALNQLGLSDEQMTDEILTALVAGHHTTGTTGAWLLFHLAQNPGLAEEIASEAEAISSDAGEIRPEKLKEAATSLALVREVLRLYPAAWWFSRETKQDMELEGHALKRGTSLIISPWQLHRNPHFWDEPDSFDPKREHTSPAFMPFGAGPRVCVGMGVALLELQLMALEMCSAFRFEGASPSKPGWPRASVTLIPPAIEISIGIRADMAAAPAAA